MPGLSTVVTIGTFDAVHRGHGALVRAARAIADAEPTPTEVVALVFDPHPLTSLRPEAAPARLSSLATKTDLLLGLGADRVIRLEPGPGVLDLDPRSFVERHVLPLGPVAVVEGPDFRFGTRRTGDVRTLESLGAELGFRVRVVPEQDVALTDQTVVRASSSITRWLLEHGRVRDAAGVLGRPHTIRGTVRRGDQRGRRLGFPTANVHTEELAPADGVYAGLATLDDGRSFPAAINIGRRPTFHNAGRSVEAHLLGPAPDEPAGDLPEYGWEVRLAFIARIRDELQFPSVDHLREQLGRDCARARQAVARHAREHTPEPVA